MGSEGQEITWTVVGQINTASPQMQVRPSRPTYKTNNKAHLGVCYQTTPSICFYCANGGQVSTKRRKKKQNNKANVDQPGTETLRPRVKCSKCPGFWPCTEEVCQNPGTYEEYWC